MLASIWVVAAAALLVSGLLELVGSVLARRFGSRLFAVLALLLLAITAGIIGGTGVNVLSIIFVVLSVYRGLNICRLIARRLERNYLRRAGLRAGLVLLAVQIVILAADKYWPTNTITTWQWVTVLAACQTAVAVVFAVSFYRQVRLARFRPSPFNMSDREWPTLTVAIPAKNETVELEECLKSVIGSDYPKLEVLVLDDAAGSRTGEIINSLAHDGVRFILGDQPTGRWLAKNLAYERLAREANGELILFCGVDVRFDRSSLRLLVAEQLNNNLKMSSVMPLNVQRLSLLAVQPMRYFWELARPRFGRSLPVLSTCWLIERRQLLRVGSFTAVKNEVVPEGYFASHCSEDGGYKFIIGGQRLGIASVKKSREQRRTVIRTRYPLLHRRLGLVVGTNLFESFFLMLGPLVLLILTLTSLNTLLAEVMAALATVIWLVIYGVILRISFRIGTWAAPAFVLAIILDLIMMNLSMIKYEFGKVMWKGRDVSAGT